MKDLLTNGKLVATILLIVGSFNIILSGLGSILDGLSNEMPDNQGLKKADGIVNSIASAFKKVIDVISANMPH